VIFAAGIVTLGFMWGVVPSSASLPATSIPSTLSLFYGVLSSLFIAFHAVLIKSSLPYCNNSTIELAWWTNVGSAILILPFVLLRQEPSKLFELSQTNTWDWSVFFSGSLVTGIFGFLLCIAGLLSIKITSPITHMFSSVSTSAFTVWQHSSRPNSFAQAARSILQTGLSIQFFGDILTVYVNFTLIQVTFLTFNKFCSNRAASIGIILAGTMQVNIPFSEAYLIDGMIRFYTWAKSLESPPLPSQRIADVELGHGSTNKRNTSANKDRLEHAVSGQVTDEKDVRN
jgi:GDP-fucose transporter C1